MRLLLLSVIALLVACSEGPKSTYQLAQQGLLSGAVNAEENLAVIGSIHHGGSLWDVQRNERLFSWNLQEGGFSSFRTVAISADGKVAVTTEERNIGVWSAESGESKGFWQAADRVLALALSEDGSKALIGMRNGMVDFFDLRSGQVLQRMKHQAEVRSVAISADAKLGLSGSDDFSAKSWDLTSGENLQTLTLRNQIKTVALSNDGKLAFTSAQREGISLWDPERGTVEKSIEARYTNYSSVDFSDDDRTLVLGTAGGVVEQRSVSSGELTKKWQAKPRKAYGGASSKAIVAVQAQRGAVLALSADGLAQRFK